MADSFDTDYLQRLSSAARHRGDHSKGEIEIVAEPEAIAAIVEERRRTLETLGLSADADRLGILVDDEYLLVVRDPVRFPSGKLGTYLRIIERPALDGAAGVVLLPVRDDVVFLREVFRHATRRWELELPRGFRKPGESLAEDVARELAEEIGIDARETVPLGTIASNTGLLAGTAEAFLVRLGAGQPQPHPEREEAFGAIVTLTAGQLLEKVRAGTIRDGYTLSALLLAQTKQLLAL